MDPAGLRCALGLALLTAACQPGSARLEGRWERADNPGQAIEFRDGRMTHHYPHGGKPIVGSYEVIEDGGSHLLIEPMIELVDGRTLSADRQRIEFVEPDALTMKNAKNGTGGTYRRRS